MRVVLDTNVFIDAFFNVCEDCKIILKREHSGEFKLIMSNEMNEELIRIIEVSMKKFELSDEQKTSIYRLLLRALRRTEPVEPKTKFTKCEDPDDNKFFECAIEGNADYLISRDAHIHKVKEIFPEIKNKNNKSIKILYPDEFVFELDKMKLITYFNT